MKKIVLALILIATNVSIFASDGEEVFNDGTILYHTVKSNYVYVETTNQMVKNSLYNRADLVEYTSELDSTNQKVYVFKLKDYNLAAIHDKVQAFANFKK